MLAVLNMIILLFGFLMRLRKQKRARVSQARLTLANDPLTEAHKG
jgi:hypothetical protein